MTQPDATETFAEGVRRVNSRQSLLTCGARGEAVDQELHGWRRAVAFPLELLIRMYRLLVSPLLGDVCRFYPTCSRYGLTAVRRFGMVRGSWLIMRRLLRCHPWNPGGVDHVPLRDAEGRPMRDNGASPGD